MTAPALEQAVADYLSLRRAVGFRLERAERLLAQFLAYLAEHHIEVITTEVAMAWAVLPTDAEPRWWNHRLGTVRAFAAYLHTLDPWVQVPPAGLIRCGPRRATPDLYTPGRRRWCRWCGEGHADSRTLRVVACLARRGAAERQPQRSQVPALTARRVFHRSAGAVGYGSFVILGRIVDTGRR